MAKWFAIELERRKFSAVGQYAAEFAERVNMTRELPNLGGKGSRGNDVRDRRIWVLLGPSPWRQVRLYLMQRPRIPTTAITAMVKRPRPRNNLKQGKWFDSTISCHRVGCNFELHSLLR